MKFSRLVKFAFGTERGRTPLYKSLRYIPKTGRDFPLTSLTFLNFFLAERLNNVEPSKMVSSKTIKVPRERLLRPWFHSPLSKFQSSLMFRRAWVDWHHVYRADFAKEHVFIFLPAWNMSLSKARRGGLCHTFSDGCHTFFCFSQNICQFPSVKALENNLRPP